MMLSTIGFAANEQPGFWREALVQAGVTTIVETPIGDLCAKAVQAWVVVLAKTDDPTTHSCWLRSLNAPIIVITQRTSALQRLAPQLPKLAFICHPLRAELDLATFLVLATRRTGGVSVMNAPRFYTVMPGVQTCR